VFSFSPRTLSPVLVDLPYSHVVPHLLSHHSPINPSPMPCLLSPVLRLFRICASCGIDYLSHSMVQLWLTRSLALVGFNVGEFGRTGKSTLRQLATTHIEMFIGYLQPFHQMPRRSRSATLDDGLGLTHGHVRGSGHQGHLYFHNEDIPVDLPTQRLCGLKQGHTKYRGTASRWCTSLTLCNGSPAIWCAPAFRGYDPSYKFQLYHSDPSENHSSWKTTCIGADNGTAQSSSKQAYKDEISTEGTAAPVLQ
jgi:hypothetical protein